MKLTCLFQHLQVVLSFLEGTLLLMMQNFLISDYLQQEPHNMVVTWHPNFYGLNWKRRKMQPDKSRIKD